MDENSQLNEGFIISLFGRKLEDDEMILRAKERFDIGKKQKPTLARLFEFFTMFPTVRSI